MHQLRFSVPEKMTDYLHSYVFFLALNPLSGGQCRQYAIVPSAVAVDNADHNNDVGFGAGSSAGFNAVDSEFYSRSFVTTPTGA